MIKNRPILLFLFAMAAFSVAKAQDPEAKFGTSAKYVCQGQIIDFTNNSKNADSFYWKFGNGDVSFLKNPKYAYKEVKDSNEIFTVTLVAIKIDTKKEDSVKLDIKVEISAHAEYAADSVVQRAVWFTHTCKNYTNLEWNFDDPDSKGENIKYSDIQNLFHFFSKGGTYHPRLIASTDFQCSDTFSKELIIYDSTGGSVGEFGIPFKINTYPNPFTDYVNIELEDFESASNSTLRIMDINGQMLYSQFIGTKQKELKINLDAIWTDQPAATYFLLIDNVQSTYIFKLSKK